MPAVINISRRITPDHSFMRHLMNVIAKMNSACSDHNKRRGFNQVKNNRKIIFQYFARGWHLPLSKRPSQISDCTFTLCELKQSRKKVSIFTGFSNLAQELMGVRLLMPSPKAWTTDISQLNRPEHRSQACRRPTWSMQTFQHQRSDHASSRPSEGMTLPTNGASPIRSKDTWGCSPCNGIPLALESSLAYSKFNHGGSIFLRSDGLVFCCDLSRAMAQESQELTKQPTFQDTSSTNI